MKTILGLDLGTNSIGWALIEQDFDKKEGKIVKLGSRIIPMSQDILGEFGKGNSVSQTAERTGYRGVRRLRERHLLRRERLHRVLNMLGFLPEHYSDNIDFEKRYGQFIPDTESKIPYKPMWNEAKQKKEFQFLFKNSFAEMLADFKQHQPQIATNEKGEDKLIPYDWTIYYLRKKALSKKIGKEGLAWILLNFNQKRGYYQLRGEEEEENANKLVEFHSLKIVDVIADEAQKKGETWYSLILENGWIYRRSSKLPLFDWKEKVKDFIITTELNDDGTIKKDKEGKEKRSFRSPGEDDWTLLKKKTEQEIDKSHKTVGTFIYDSLLQNPKQKIKGKLVRTIERKFYKHELKKILEKQKEFHPELQSENLYADCVRELYKNNHAQQQILSSKDFVHLFLDDIIFYQRPLRSQKSSISNCTLEYRKYKDENGIEHIQYLKVIPKSNPYYQEFRLWQWMYNLSIYKKENDANVTHEFLNSREDWEKLFEFLNRRKEVNHKDILTHFITPKIKSKFPDVKPAILNKEVAKEVSKYRWNYVFDDSKEKEDDKSKKYPCNETGYELSKRIKTVKSINENFLNRDIEQSLWHIIYSVTDKEEYEKALKSFAKKHDLDEASFSESFKKFAPFKSEYGSFSEKAIKKLLPLLRIGTYWSWDSINEQSKERIEKIITGEYDENIKDRVRDKAIHLTTKNDFQGLQLWLAQYIIYGRHSEAAVEGKWNSVNDLEKYLNDFKQHSLRNPIVDQVITETLRVVKDVWAKYGNGAKDFFDEIHIELGREMKKTKEERKNETQKITDNENTNLRIKVLLAEMMNDPSVENVRPFSPMQQEILKVYEEGALNSDIEIADDILKISKTAQPSSADLKRYKLWLEQKYRSPYTGEVIPLNKLFTPEYEIEHIIPQSRYFDDSFSNKVICEAAVNKLKDNQLGLEFIKNHHGTILEIGLSKKPVKIFEVNDYEDFVKQHYAKNRGKRNKLLMEEIPEKMIERQMNDTRHISKYISNVLSNIVRAEANDDGINSKNLIPCNGKITTELKHDWGLNDIWNELILPRFERLNRLNDVTHFTAWNEKHQKFLPTVPLELSKNFSAKRIDHRHHAMDALVIACATRDHIYLLNNQYAKSSKRYDLNRKLRNFVKVIYNHPQTSERIEKDVPKDFIKPWKCFTTDAKNSLENIVVSFKQNIRVINKATNYYEKWIDNNGVITKELVQQTGINWAIRKSMHKETVSGKVHLKKIKIPKDKILTATRKSLDTSFNLQAIEYITDTGIQKILRNYLAVKDNNPELAFSPEGIDNMNKDIERFNDGKKHQPILKVRVFEVGSKFPLGQSGNKKSKYVEAAKGTNLFFAVFADENKKRNYETIPLNIVIERQKQNLNEVPLENERGDKLLFYLSPNDLVYVPTEDESINNNKIDFYYLTKTQIKRLYNVNDFSGTCYFTPNTLAKAIAIKEVDLSFDNKKNKTVGSFDTKTASLEGKQIKDYCIKLNIDRLGNITPAKTNNYNQQTGISNTLSEPEVAYQKTTFQTYSSHEEANEATAKEKAGIAPQQHLANVAQRIKNMYADELKTPMDKTLKFRKDD